MLHNRLHHIARPAHNTAIAGGVGHVQGQQGQVFTAAQVQQRAQRSGLRQGHIARENQGHTVVCQHRNGLLYGMAGAQLRFLPHKLQTQRGRGQGRQSGFHHLCTVSGNHHRLPRAQLARTVDHMPGKRPPSELVQHFGLETFHACAFARRHDHHIHRNRHNTPDSAPPWRIENIDYPA